MAFADGLISVVAVERDVQTVVRGVVTHAWQPVAGLSAVPCRIVEQSSQDTDYTAREGVKASGKVLFGQEVNLDPRCRLVYQDPSAGQRRVLTCRGKSRNAHQMGHHWVVDFDEFTGAAP